MFRALKGYFFGEPEPRASIQEVSIFTRQLATMLDAGIPLHHSLDAFSSGLASGGLAEALDKVATRVASGWKFSRSLGLYPKIFSVVYRGLIESGENSGKLAEVLNNLADLQEKQVKMRQRITATLAYPVVLIAMSLLSISVFVMFVLPQTQAIFISMKLELPWPTRVLMASRYFIPLAAVAAGALLFFLSFGQDSMQAFLDKRPRLRRFLHRVPLAIPMMGPVYQKIILTRILYTLASMLSSGLSLVSALKNCANVAGNEYICERLKVAVAVVVDGDLLSEAFKQSGIFTPAAIHIIRAGEETSSMATMIDYVARMFDEDTDLMLQTVANALEPLLMAGMGLVVGFIVIASMLPTMQLIQNL